MKNTFALLAGVALSVNCIAQTGANMLISISSTGHSFYLTSDKQVEVIQLEIEGSQPYTHWGVDLDRPALFASERTMFHAAFPVQNIRIESVSYSDGTVHGGAGAWVVHQSRDQIRSGNPVRLSSVSEWNAPIRHLLLQHARKFPETQVQVLEAESDSIPDLTSPPWFVQGSMTMFAVINGLPIYKSVDLGGNPYGYGGCWYTCTATETLQALCPPGPPPPIRASITASGSGGCDCPTEIVNMYGAASYGTDGLGGPYSQRFGVVAAFEFEGKTTVSGSIEDSCFWTRPSMSGGFGIPCN